MSLDEMNVHEKTVDKNDTRQIVCNLNILGSNDSMIVDEMTVVKMSKEETAVPEKTANKNDYRQNETRQNEDSLDVCR